MGSPPFTIDLPTRPQSLLVKQTRFERVLELWHRERLSTFCIAERLCIDETEVCRLIEEGDSQCWREHHPVRAVAT